MTCDVSRCGRPAVVEVRFWVRWVPYCAWHGLGRSGAPRWPGYPARRIGRSAPS